MKEKKSYDVVGLMSGTSLDGLDIAYCTFQLSDKGWQYKIQSATTLKYPSAWQKKLATAHLQSAEALLSLDSEYGLFLGQCVADFLKQHRKAVDFIASHGHTVFHQPQKKFTFQLGHGNAIYAKTGIPVVYDFRSLDVLKGGEGAPLVPAGDKFLFQDYDVCLNLGGIANLSADVKKQRIAFDIAFCNMLLNYLMSKKGKAFDKNGAASSDGEINKKLLSKLTSNYNAIRKSRPSLGRELFEKKFQPLLDDESIPFEDRLRTCTESTAAEIVEAIRPIKKGASVLCTGGGAFNSFLMSTMLDHAGDDISFVLPDEEVIKFKEALVFGFLGVLRIRDEINCLKSVTRASSDSSSGVLVGF